MNHFKIRIALKRIIIKELKESSLKNKIKSIKSSQGYIIINLNYDYALNEYQYQVLEIHNLRNIVISSTQIKFNYIDKNIKELTEILQNLENII